MEFWGVEVKAGDVVKVDPEKEAVVIHLSQAALGEAKKDKASEPVVLHLKVGDQKFVLGTLLRENIPQISFDIGVEKEFELSHTSKNASVYFCGYKLELQPRDDSAGKDDYSGSEDDEYDISLMDQDNGKVETKAEEAKVAETKKPVAKVKASEKQVKDAPEPIPAPESDDDSDEDSDEDESGSSEDEMDADSGSEEGSESEDDDEDEETPPKKVELGKKRANDSASKTPLSNKKAKNATPEKIDGKKSGHAATPHPMKKAGKTPTSEAKDQTPKSGGQFFCKSCSKSFNSEGGLQQHNKAKHGGQ